MLCCLKRERRDRNRRWLGWFVVGIMLRYFISLLLLLLQLLLRTHLLFSFRSRPSCRLSISFNLRCLSLECLNSLHRLGFVGSILISRVCFSFGVVTVGVFFVGGRNVIAADADASLQQFILRL